MILERDAWKFGAFNLLSNAGSWRLIWLCGGHQVCWTAKYLRQEGWWVKPYFFTGIITMKVFKWWQQHLLPYYIHSTHYTKNLNIMYLSLASLWVDHGETTGTQGNGTVLVFFFPCEGGVQLFSLNGNNFAELWELLPTGLVWVLISGIIPPDQYFFVPFYFISMPDFNIICCGCSCFLLGKGYLSLILCPLPSGFGWLLVVSKRNSPGVP